MNEDEIFHHALARSLPEERAAYLERACAGNPALRSSIEALLRANDGASGFLSGPAVGEVGELDQSVRVGPGTIIGPYNLLEQIGEGGMGVVYMAEQKLPMKRKVALKIIKPGMDTRQVIARFEAERQALAMMDHPNIARIIDGGATESGRPYFVMELVKGIPVTEYCDRHRLTIEERLDLFVLVCQAVHHAHQKGIIHRDLKPSNVMITLHDGTPVPKIIDFGIAKATGQERLSDKTLFTSFAQWMGTPQYMSPEQAELSGIDVDTRSDIYSLGVLLYELLTGTTPFDQDTFRTAALDEVRRIIREQDPPTPSTRILPPLQRGGTGGWPRRSVSDAESAVSTNRQTDPRKLSRSLRGELDWITMKAIEKDRTRRYDSAGSFAADIRRHLAGQPVEAGPPSTWYRLSKFARRHRLALTMSAIVGLSLGLIGWMWADSAARLDHATRTVEASRAEIRRRALEARRHRYAADIRQAYELVQSGRTAEVLELLNKWLPAPGELDLRNFAWHYLMRLCHDERLTLRGHEGAVYHAGFSPDGRTLVSCGQDGTVRFWEVATGRALRSFVAHHDEVNCSAFSPDGRTLATVSDDGTIKLWNVGTGAEQATISAHKGDAIAVRFTPDGKWLISAGRDDGLVKLWDLKTLKDVVATRASEGTIEGLSLAPDGRTLATVGGVDYARIWNVADLSLKKSLHLVRQGPVYGLAFSTDGTRIATADAGGRVLVWDLKAGEPLPGFKGFAHADDAQAVAFLDGDRMVVSGDGHAMLRLSDSTTGQSLTTLNGHTAKVWGISVSPDGTTVATVSSDGTVKLWDARLPERWLAIPVANVRGSIAFSPDGQTLVLADVVEGKPSVPRIGVGYTVDADLEVRGIDPKSGAKRIGRTLARGQKVYGPWLATDGAVAIFTQPGDTWPGDRATAWEVATGKRLATIDSFFWLDRSRLVAIKFPGGPIELMDAVSGQRRPLKGTESAEYVRSAQDGRIVALRNGDRLAIWDQATNGVRHSHQGIRSNWHAGAFTPDATLLCLVETDRPGEIQLWDVSTVELLDSLPGHLEAIADMDFSPDGRLLASVGNGGVVKLWDVAAHSELLTLRPPCPAFPPIRFASDGQTLAFRAGTDGSKGWVYLLQTALPEDLASGE